MSELLIQLLIQTIYSKVNQLINLTKNTKHSFTVTYKRIGLFYCGFIFLTEQKHTH